MSAAARQGGIKATTMLLSKATTATTIRAMSTRSSSITKYLTSPNRVAQALDWRKHKQTGASVLSLHVHKDRIDLAVTNHPTMDTAVQPLPSIPLKKQQQTLHPCVVEELRDICDDWQVCGFVVSWPVQKEGGRCGAPCGRVLHTLDQLVASQPTTTGAGESHNSSTDDSAAAPLFSAARPVCLWDAHHVTPTREDEWGRTATNARTSHKSVHYASVEQYNVDQDATALSAAEMAADYMRCHFPELRVMQQQQAQTQDYVSTTAGKTTSSTLSGSAAPPVVPFDLSWLDAYEQTDAYCARAAL